MQRARHARMLERDCRLRRAGRMPRFARRASGGAAQLARSSGGASSRPAVGRVCVALAIAVGGALRPACRNEAGVVDEVVGWMARAPTNPGWSDGTHDRARPMGPRASGDRTAAERTAEVLPLISVSLHPRARSRRFRSTLAGLGHDTDIGACHPRASGATPCSCCRGFAHVRSPQSGPRVELTAIAHTPVRSLPRRRGRCAERVRLVGRVLRSSRSTPSRWSRPVGGRPR